MIPRQLYLIIRINHLNETHMTQESFEDESSSEPTIHAVDDRGNDRGNNPDDHLGRNREHRAISSREHRAERARAWQRMQYMDSPLGNTGQEEIRDGEK